MFEFDDVLYGRNTLATLCGISTFANDGSAVEQAPCNMSLGDAVLQLAAAHATGMDTREALVVWQGGILDRKACLTIANRFGERLASH